jgi:hypothetical protein
LSFAPAVPHEEVLEFVMRRRLVRRGIGWIDAHLLASALSLSALLWSMDRGLDEAARAVDACFTPTGA